MKNLRVYIRPLDHFRKCEIYVYEEDRTHEYIADKIGYGAIMTEIERGAECKPTAELPMPLMHEIVNAAFKAGIRAEAPEATEEELKATKKHLEDMRKLVGKSMGVKL